MIRLISPHQVQTDDLQTPTKRLFALYFARAVALADVLPIDCWQQTDENGACTALLFRQNDTVFICAEPSAQQEELRQFVLMLGATLCCDQQACRALGLNATRSYEVMQKQTSGREDTMTPPRGEDLYALLSACFPMPLFAQWYPDFYLALRRGVSRVFYHEQQQLCAAVLALSLTSNACLLSGVATLPSHRPRGYVSKLLAKAQESLGTRTLFLLAEPSMIPFYQKYGFSSCGRWSETEF